MKSKVAEAPRLVEGVAFEFALELPATYSA